jgi:UDP-N-acetylglucosamine--N-acetylmuramyl-(pentapeptide) pyrophosphoryl-undecaprenol N-acetylglucosamine transferase
VIGYYAHHHGVGHLRRADTITRHLVEPVTLLSTLVPADPHPFAHHVRLASDSEGVAGARDATASGALHWAPVHDRGLQARMAQIVEWVRTERPAVMVVDVSVEVTNLARLLGVPVVVIAMPGRRDDSGHQWGYRLADRVIAPWPREIYDPAWLRPFHDRTSFVGAFSRFDARAAPASGVPFRRGLILCGAGGGALGWTHVRQIRERAPEVVWDVVGGPAGWRQDVWSALCAADVVVSHGGQNAVSEIAAARRPAVLVPEARPHQEQEHACEALRLAGIARSCSDWLSVGAELAKPVLDPERWTRWALPDGAAAAARVISGVAAAADRRG